MRKVLPSEGELEGLSVCKGMLNAKLGGCECMQEARKDKKGIFKKKGGFKRIFEKEKGG